MSAGPLVFIALSRAVGTGAYVAAAVLGVLTLLPALLAAAVLWGWL